MEPTVFSYSLLVTKTLLCQRVSIRMSACQLTIRSTLEATATKVMTVFSLSPIRCTVLLLRCDLAEVDIKVRYFQIHFSPE